MSINSTEARSQVLQLQYTGRHRTAAENESIVWYFTDSSIVQFKVSDNVKGGEPVLLH